MRKIFFFASLSIVLFSSCSLFGGKRIRGNGAIKTEIRSVANFERIDVSGATDVYVKQDSVYVVKVETDENLMEYLIIENENGTLRIHQKEGTNLQPSKRIKVYVSGPAFKRFDASGACNYISEGLISSEAAISISSSGSCDVKMELKAPKIEADLTGAGSITLKGEAKEFEVDGSGSTDVNCFELITENATVQISGSGNAEVFAGAKLNVEVSGSGDVKYKGNAAVSQSISGSGSVKKVD